MVSSNVTAAESVGRSDAIFRLNFDMGNLCHVDGKGITLKEGGRRAVKRLENCRDYIIEGALNAYYVANVVLRFLFNFFEQAGRALDISRVAVLLYLPHACSRLTAVLATYTNKSTKWFRVSQLVGDITFASIVGSHGFAHIFLGKGDLLEAPLNYVFGIGSVFRVLQLCMIHHRLKMVVKMEDRLEKAKEANFENHGSPKTQENLLNQFNDEELYEYFYVTPKEVENLRKSSNEIYSDDPVGANTRIYSHLKDRLAVAKEASRYETVAAVVSIIAGVLFLAAQFTPAGPVANVIALIAYAFFATGAAVNLSEYVHNYKIVNSKLPKLRKEENVV